MGQSSNQRKCQDNVKGVLAALDHIILDNLESYV